MSTFHLLLAFPFLGFLFFIWVTRREMSKIFYYFMASFDNFSKGASSKKICAYAGIGVAIYVTKRHTDTTNAVMVNIVWLLFVLLCLGLVVFNNIIELIQSYKGGNNGKTIIDDKPSLDTVLKNKSDEELEH